jgi:hypothetical protein
MARPRGRDLAAFWKAVDTTGGPDACWPRRGRLREGYGVYGKPPVGAHRFACELAKGPIPEGLRVDHLCHNQDSTCPGGETCEHRRCVNPAHLEPVTQRENILRSPLTMPHVNAAKTHCPSNHPYDEVNTYTRPGTNKRDCRTCRRTSRREANRLVRLRAIAP